MFGLFKKTSWKIEGKAFAFFDKLFQQLPAEFQFLATGLQRGLFQRFSVNPSLKGHHYTIGFDALQSDKAMTKGTQFVLRNIVVVQNAQEFLLNLTIYEGLWAGFEMERKVLECTNFQIDLARMYKDDSRVAIDPEIGNLVRGLSSTRLDLHDLPAMEVSGKYYYQIKDLEDGNYIAIDHLGQVFGLLQDPNKIERINKSLKRFVEDVNSGLFDFDRYLEAHRNDGTALA